MARYGYEPIPTDLLPAAYSRIFADLCETFTPPNDSTCVRTLDGRSLELVCVARTKKGPKEPEIPIGYQKAMWELREGHLRWCPSQKRLWRRDADRADHEGERYVLNSWHPVKSIEDEYSIKPSMTLPAYAQTIEAESARQGWFDIVERGVRIGRYVWVRRDGGIVALDDQQLAVTQTFDTTGLTNEAVEQAERICRWLTADEKSYRNLVRMFCTPWLEPFKQLSYVLSGHGGDGKTLVMSQCVLGVLGDGKVFPSFSAAQYCQSGGYTLTRESMNDAMD
ncbi:MAG: DNA primase, partial [Bifidobacterium castoris]|nr:DNA primase [Bifidobacterium castoris]